MLAFIATSSLGAQLRPDSSATTGRLQRLWVSAGVGGGTSPSSLAAVVTGWYTRGPVAVGARASSLSQWDGEQRGDRAFLIGGRTASSHSFLVGALGIARVSSGFIGDDTGFDRPTVTAPAYSVEAHLNQRPGGWGVAAMMFGALGPADHSFNAIAFTLNLGWFGD